MSAFKNLGRYGTVGFDLLLSMGLGFFGGQWLDRRYFDNRGTVTLIGFAIGLAVGFRNLFRVAKQAAREADAEAVRERDGTMEYHDEYLEIARKPSDDAPTEEHTDERTEREADHDATKKG